MQHNVMSCYEGENDHVLSTLLIPLKIANSLIFYIILFRILTRLLCITYQNAHIYVSTFVCWVLRYIYMLVITLHLLINICPFMLISILYKVHSIFPPWWHCLISTCELVCFSTGSVCTFCQFHWWHAEITWCLHQKHVTCDSGLHVWVTPSNIVNWIG